MAELPTSPADLDRLPVAERDAVVAAVLQWMSAKGYRITHPAAEPRSCPLVPRCSVGACVCGAARQQPAASTP